MPNGTDFVFNKYGVKFTYRFRYDQMEMVTNKMKVHFNTKAISVIRLPFSFRKYQLRPKFMLNWGNKPIWYLFS